MKAFQSPLAALLCCILCSPATLGFAQEAQPAAKAFTDTKPDATANSRPGVAERPHYQSAQLEGNERIIHALNRFTFGPKPGDVDEVRAIGLEKWFDRQLHPETIDQTDLNTRLAEFPAMQWTTAQLLYYLPGNGVIRQAINGKAEIPPSGVMHAIYENQIYRIDNKKQAKAEKTAQTVQPVNQQPQQAAAATTGVLMSDGTMAPAPAGTANASVAAQAGTGMGQANQDQSMSGGANAMGAQPAMTMQDQPQFDPAEAARIIGLQPQQRVAQLAAMQPEEFDSFIKSLKGPQRQALNADLTPAQKQTIGALENPERLVAEELIASRLTRDIYSQAQLQEVMTDFWLNHFNVYLRKNEQMPYYLVSYERDAIRPHVLGKFEDMLEAVAHSPAMLMYLDNAQSIGPDSVAAERAEQTAAKKPDAKKQAPEGLNENYARELMELHTVGVNGGYTQADVIQAARILTGWGIDRPLYDAEFTFNPNRHEPGTKTVMGEKFKEDGELEGRELLHMLATRPQTAEFLSRKLAIRFVSDDPPQALVDRMAKAYLASDGDIAETMRAMFHAPEFWAKANYRAKVKTPLEFVVSAARASNASVGNLQGINNGLRQLGMPVYGQIPPTGYKWDAADWVSTGALVDRMNFALTLAANHVQGVVVGWAPLPDLAGPDAAATPTPTEEETRLEAELIPGGASQSTRNAALEQFAVQTGTTASAAATAAAKPNNAARNANQLEKQDQVLAGLLIGSPEFQRR
jgi:uncharacterized protein (DUF1800 family)